MWNDVETTQDLLNFKVVADTAAQMIKLKFPPLFNQEKPKIINVYLLSGC